MKVYYDARDAVFGGPDYGDAPTFDNWLNGWNKAEDYGPMSVAFCPGRGWVVVDHMGVIMAEGSPKELGQWMTQFLEALEHFEAEHTREGK